MITSGSFEIDFPKYVSYRKSDQGFYHNMTDKDSNTPFSALTMADVFIYAMSIGFKIGRPTPFLEGEKMPSLPARAFDTTKRWLMRALAITDKEDLEIITHNNRVVEIAEGYANTGIGIMIDLWEKSRIDVDGSTAFESDLREHIKGIRENIRVSQDK